MLTAERLRLLLRYDPATGLFTRLHSCGGRRAGSVAGYIDRRDGYRIIRVDDKLYPASNLAWLYVTGRFPQLDIDHWDGDRANDKWANLRHVTRTVNSENRSTPAGRNPYIGVCWHRRAKKWVACISHGGVAYHLGLFTNAEDARDAYIAAKRKLHSPSRLTSRTGIDSGWRAPMVAPGET
jgi:HNH endonuclease/AP2 domain